jgi:hypothetical protein
MVAFSEVYAVADSTMYVFVVALNDQVWRTKKGRRLKLTISTGSGLKRIRSLKLAKHKMFSSLENKVGYFEHKDHRIGFYIGTRTSILIAHDYASYNLTHENHSTRFLSSQTRPIEAGSASYSSTGVRI